MCGTATWAELLRAAAGRAAVLGVLVLAGCGGGDGSRNAGDPRLVTVPPDTLAAWMDRGRPLALYDLRPDSLFEAGRIPGSIHVRGMGLADFSQTLPPDPEAPVVVRIHPR